MKCYIKQISYLMLYITSECNMLYIASSANSNSSSANLTISSAKSCSVFPGPIKTLSSE